MDKIIWKSSGEWFYIVDNILVGVKNVSTYKKENCTYLFNLVFFG